MINTINISLPTQLKSEAEKLIEGGYFVSFSDLTRTAIRKLVESKYDYLIEEAKADHAKQKLAVMSNETDIDNYFKNLK